MLYGMETVTGTSSLVKKLEVTDMKMCRWACGHKLTDHVRNENTKERLKVESIAVRCRKARLRWFGHVKRRYQDYVGRKTLEMVPPGRRKRGRPKQRWMDCVNRDMRHESHRNDERRCPWQNWLEENCVRRSDPTTKWERLEEEEKKKKSNARKQPWVESHQRSIAFNQRKG